MQKFSVQAFAVIVRVGLEDFFDVAKAQLGKAE